MLLADVKLIAHGAAPEILTSDYLARAFGTGVAALVEGDRSFWVPVGRA